MICFTPPAAPATCAEAFADDCIVNQFPAACDGQFGFGLSIDCVTTPDSAGDCCYIVAGVCADPGRPFTVEGRARLATLLPGGGWQEPLAPDVAGLDAATRAALADAWGQTALSEHASIASFSRFVMQLLALGAPSDLVLAAQRALAEEHAHALACFGLASAYAGLPLGPGALDVSRALDGQVSPAAIAASLAGEGCVAETISALHVACARDEARDPVVKAALTRIAEQEMEHALLAWRALDWMLSRGDAAVRAAVAGVFADAEAHVALGAVTALGGQAADLRAHGYLPVEERRALAREALGRVVGPAATAVLRDPRRVRPSAASATLAG